MDAQHAVKARKITQSQSDAYLSLASKDYCNTKQILESLPVAIELADERDSRETKQSLWQKRNNEIEETNKQY